MVWKPEKLFSCLSPFPPSHLCSGSASSSLSVNQLSLLLPALDHSGGLRKGMGLFSVKGNCGLNYHNDYNNASRIRSFQGVGGRNYSIHQLLILQHYFGRILWIN